MPYIQIDRLKRAFPLPIRKGINESLDELQKADKRYPVFISHSFRDRELIYALKQMLLTLEGVDAYVDWIDDPFLDRTQVSPATANRIRARIHQANVLLVAASPHIQTSRWVPWEIGCADGAGKRIGVLPLLQHTGQSLDGIEFIGLYPVFEVFTNRMSMERVGTPTQESDTFELISTWASR